MTTIVTRAGKGSALTHNEVDSNFTNLNSAKYESGNNATFGTLAYTSTLTGGTGVVNLGSGQFYKDASGNVGIGGANDTFYGKFQVLGSSYQAVSVKSTDASGVVLAIAANSSIDSRINTVSNHPMSFYTNNTERMRIDSSGNVGIGTSSVESGFRLHVVGNAFVTNTSGQTIGKVVVDSADNRLVLGSYFEAGIGQLSFISSTDNAETANIPLAFRTGTTERMRIDTSGNVGIGTSGSIAKLQILSASSNNTVAGQAFLTNRSYSTGNNGISIFATASNGTLGTHDFGAITFNEAPNSNGGSAYVNMYAGGASSSFGNASRYLQAYSSAATSVNYVALWTGSNERMRIDSSGNVGIGTSSPTALLNVHNAQASGTTATMQRWSWSSTDPASSWGLRLDQIHTGSAIEYALRVKNGSTLHDSLYLQSSGNVGIGTSSPSSRLSVSTATSASVINLTNTSGTSEWQQNGNDLFFTNYNASGSAIFRTNGTERMRIDSSGNLLVGTTTLNGTGGLSIKPSESEGATQVLFNRTNRTTTSYPLDFKNAGNTVGYIAFTNTATTYSTSSDYRLKENIAPMTGALDVVAQLKPVTYTWKADGSDGQGFIAHELAEVVPDAVVGEKDAVDKDGNPKYQGIDTSFLVATLTAAIQELSAKVDTLQAELNTLKGN